MKEKIKGLLLCLAIAVPAWLLGRKFAVVGGPVISILLGMIVGMFLKNRAPFDAGIKFTSKKILQWAVILLGFGMNLTVIGQTGVQSLPIILSTITTSLLIAFILCKALKIPSKISTLVGVGSSICGGSAIAATAPVIDASDEEVAQAISVIFFLQCHCRARLSAHGHASRLFNHLRRGLRHFRRNCGERHLVRHRRRLDLGQHVGARLADAG